MLHFVHPESFCPLGISCRDVAAQGAELNLQLPWAPLAFVPLLPSDRGNLLLSLPLPPHLGAVSSWQPFPAPARLQWCLCACWERLLGMCLIPGSVLLFLGCQTELWARQPQSWIAQVSGREQDREGCQRGAVRPQLALCAVCAGGCVLALQGASVPFPNQPNRSQGLLEPYFIPYFSLW